MIVISLKLDFEEGTQYCKSFFFAGGHPLLWGQVFGFLFQGKSLSHFLCTTRVWWKSRSQKEEDESSASDSGDSLPPLEFIKDGTKQKVEEIGPGAWVKEMGWTTVSQQKNMIWCDFQCPIINDSL